MKFIIEVAGEFSIEDMKRVLMGVPTLSVMLAPADEDPLWVVAIGNPFDGLGLHGPFNDQEVANTWAENCQNDWWVVEVNKPD